jgi:predicted Rossmann fold nucleotide-binding protein DprA/Smf involved in DNA uptake
MFSAMLKQFGRELTRLLGQTSAKVSASLLKLEIEGFVYNEGNGVYAKNL